MRAMIPRAFATVRSLFLVATLAGCVQSPAPPAYSVDERIAQVESALLPRLVITNEPDATESLDVRMARYGVPAVSIAVIVDGEVEWARAYGMADVESARLATTETLFQAASISKPVAALAALHLAEQGNFGLDDNVNDHLISWQMPDTTFTATEKVTLRRLLNHTAGTTVWGFPGYARSESVPSSVQVLDGEGNTDPIRVYKAPGESWQYSGGGYTVMQLLLSDAAGKPFPRLMEETVLQPLGMTRSTYTQPLPDARHDEAASGYRGDGAKVDGDWHTYPEMAAAGLWTTPSDLAKFAIHLQRAYANSDTRLLSQAMAREMMTPGMNGHGLGPGISDDTLRFGHGGANEGFRCQLTAFKDGRGGIVIMTNSDSGSLLAQEILLTVARAYGWPGIEPTTKTVADISPEAIQAVTGTYRLDFGDARIALENDTLKIRADFLETPIVLLPESDSLFFDRSDGTPFRFFREDGTVTRMLVDQRVEATKLP